MCTGIELALLAATTAAAELARETTRNAAKRQAGAAADAARTQQQAFAASQASFATLVAPEPEVIKSQAKDEALKRRQRAALTVLTSPVGITGEPNLTRKTLLGQ